MSIAIIFSKFLKLSESLIQDFLGELNLDSTADTLTFSNLSIALKTITDLPDLHLANNKKSKELSQSFQELSILSTKLT